MRTPADGASYIRLTDLIIHWLDTRHGHSHNFFYLAGETEVSVTALVVLSQFSGSTTLLSTIAIVGMSVSVSVSVVISRCQYCQEVYIWSIALTLPDLPLT